MEFRELQSWHGLRDSNLTCQESYPPMTRHEYVGGQVSSSSRIDFIFLTPLLHNMTKSTYTEVFPNSDHMLLVCTLSNCSQKTTLKSWKKKFPCNLTGWRFSKDLKNSLKLLNTDCSLDQWELFKKNLVLSSCKSQSQRLFSYRAKLKRAQNVLSNLEKFQPRNKFSLSWSQKWSEAFETVKQLQKVETRTNQICAGAKWSSSGEKCNKFYLSRAAVKKSSSRLDEVEISPNMTSKDPETISSAVFNFYSKLYTSEPDPDCNINDFVYNSGPQNTPCNVFAPIKEEEVIAAIKSSSRNKCPGPDGIPFELYRKYCTKLAPILTSLFNHCIQNSTYPPGAK